MNRLSLREVMSPKVTKGIMGAGKVINTNNTSSVLMGKQPCYFHEKCSQSLLFRYQVSKTGSFVPRERFGSPINKAYHLTPLGDGKVHMLI